MGLDLRKFRKNCLISRFLSEKKSLDMGRGFGPRATHFVKKQLEYPPPPGQ